MTEYVFNHNLIILPEDMNITDDENNEIDEVPNVVSIYVTPEQYDILLPKGSDYLKEAPKYKRV